MLTEVGQWCQQGVTVCGHMPWSYPYGTTAEVFSPELGKGWTWLPVNGKLAEQAAGVGQRLGNQVYTSLLGFP